MQAQIQVVAIFFLALLLPQQLVAKDLDHINNKNILKLLENKSLIISKSEVRVANNLAKIFEITEKGYINIALTKKVLKESRNHSVFFIYKDWLQSIIDIHSNKTTASIRETCASLADKNPKNHLKAELLKKSSIMCFNQYLKLLAKKPQNDPAHVKELSFFKQRIGNIAHPSNLESLSYFLSRFEDGHERWKAYSSVLSDYFMTSGVSPVKHLLQYMDITPELTRHIQVKGIDENGAKWVFYSELKKLIKKTFKEADEGAKEKRVLSRLKEALNYYIISYPHLPQSKSDLNVLSLGKSLTRRSYFEAARAAFEAIITLNPKDENTLFEIMWTWLTQDDYKKARSEVVKKFALDQRYKELKDERLQFWTAYTLRETGDSAHKKIFEDLIKKSALNYYSIIASKMLSEHYKMPSEKIYYQLANGESVTPESLPQFDAYSMRSLKRLKLWGRLDFKPFISLEYHNIFKVYSRVIANKNESHDLAQSQSTLILLSASILKGEENYLESFKVIYRGLNNNLISLDETALKILFPKPYLEQVSSHIDSFDPLIALSLIRQESGFNRRARSWVGARGLMQLMPATAAIYWRGIRTSHLYNPKINIKIGAKYLSMLLKKYDNNLVYALSAYNAGESRVKKWRKEYLTKSHSILHNIENIPFPETRKYVKLIFRNLFFYKMMDKKVELADSKKVNEIFDVQLGFNEPE